MRNEGVMSKAVGKMTDDELTAEAEKLAGEKKAIKDRENEVRAEQELRAALAMMSEDTRRIVQLRLDGSLAPEGTVQ